MADKQPQAAFSAMKKLLKCEWQFLQHVTPDCGGLFVPFDEVLTSLFLPTAFGNEVTAIECLLFSLPVQYGGPGVY